MSTHDGIRSKRSVLAAHAQTGPTNETVCVCVCVWLIRGGYNVTLLCTTCAAAVVFCKHVCLSVVHVFPLAAHTILMHWHLQNTQTHHNLRSNLFARSRLAWQRPNLEGRIELWPPKESKLGGRLIKVFPDILGFVLIFFLFAIKPQLIPAFAPDVYYILIYCWFLVSFGISIVSYLTGRAAGSRNATIQYLGERCPVFFQGCTSLRDM